MARPVTVTISHALGLEGARARIEGRIGELEQSIAGNMGLKFERHWEGERLHLRARGFGQNVTGEVDIFPAHVRITVMLPGLLAGMAEALAGKVEKQGRVLLGPPAAGTQ